MNILESFRINYPVKLAAVGAGGKSSFLFALANEIPGKCIVTTTTHISIDQSNSGDISLSSDDPLLFEKVISSPDNSVIVIIGTDQGKERVNGPNEEILTQLQQLCEKEKISILVEADGSKKLPLKAFGEHEPAVPEWVDVVVHVIGWNAIGKQVNDASIFRVDRYCELAGQQIGDIIDFSSIGNMIKHDNGGKKTIKNHHRSIIFFNQCPTNMKIDLSIESEIYSLLLHHHSVIFGNISTSNDNQGAIFDCFENIAAIILAAGGSSRLGEKNIKQLLQLNGKSFLQNTIDLAMKCNFVKTIVVLGYEFDRLKSELDGYSIDMINNREWENGQSTSVIAAVEQMASIPHMGGALFIPIDQPYLDIESVNRIVRCHTKNTGSTIVPKCKEHTGAPVLFDQSQFDKLLQLQGDKGGRSILNRVPHQFCEINNPLAMKDVDTMDEYRKLIEKNQ